MRFGDMLKEAREKLGLSQTDLAEKTGLPFRSIQNWEQGHRTPRLRVALTLARALSVPVEQLLLAMAEEAQPAPKPRPKKGGRS